ncbi:MAG: hypothetical protein QXD48_01065 [Candidatus Aenigmatarchaeota archaeon]
MKGVEPLQWAFIVLVLLLVFILFAINPLQQAIDAAIANNAMINANFLASIINLMQASASNMEYMLDLPKTDCIIKINEKGVTYHSTKRDIIYTMDLIQNYKLSDFSKKILIPITEINCKDKIAIIRKIGNAIMVVGG